MAVLHAAELTPTKTEMISRWLPAQSWAPPGQGDLEPVGSYRFDDPDGQVGLEVHLVRTGGQVVQVERPPIGLTATWPGQTVPLVLAEVRALASG